jgi:HTH-type transcriptional regulator/antitoxin MqsA
MTRPKKPAAPAAMTCDVCHHAMRRDTRPDSLTYKAVTHSFDQPGWYCTHCDNVVLTAADSDVFEREAMELKAEAEDILGGTAIKLIRTQVFKLSQEDASAIFGGGPNAFAKFESHQQLPSRGLSRLIKLAVQDRAVFAALKAGRLPSNTDIIKTVAAGIGFHVPAGERVKIEYGKGSGITLVAYGKQGATRRFTPKGQRVASGAKRKPAVKAHA